MTKCKIKSFFAIKSHDWTRRYVATKRGIIFKKNDFFNIIIIFFCIKAKKGHSAKMWKFSSFFTFLPPGPPSLPITLLRAFKTLKLFVSF